MVGSVLVKFSFILVLISGGVYYLSLRRQSSQYVQLARYAYQGTVVSVMAFCAFLLYLILTHQFQYTYVWNYSSTDLPTSLLVATFYAGQEGSFSLWALFTAIIGVILTQYTSKRDYEAEVMFVWSLILGFLLVMLIVKNPFAMIWETFPNELLRTGPVPPDVLNFVWLDRAANVWAQIPMEGKGLNPLLQNYWMVIHPQILFVGFSTMAVPYAFALSGLIRREYQDWVRVAKPWIVLSAAVLGTGVILGGYWAYETLGWGGYWGWDPVENSSLIPWLIAVAAIHTMMAQRRSGTFVRTNFVLCILAFIMVLYSTFLTRSGVLGETSVHSFVDPGMWAYWLLLGFMIFFVSIGAILLIRRLREMPLIPVEHSIYSREFALFLGAFAICFAAAFITIGTSSPIITTLLKGRASAVDIQYYVKTTLPLGIAIAVLAGIGQLLWWRSSNGKSVLRSLIFPTITSVLFTIGLFIAGVRDPQIVLFSFAAGFALFVNLTVGYRIFQGNPKYAGGAIAHIGLALLFLGFVSSARYDDRQTVSLEQGKSVEVLGGYQLTYIGNHQLDNERYGFHVSVTHDGETFRVMPVIRYSNFTKSTLRHPDVVNMYTKDFYLSPLSVESPEDTKVETVELIKSEKRQVGNLQVTFVDFDFSDTEKGKMATGEGFSIGVILEVENEGEKETLKLLMKNAGGSVTFVPATAPGGEIEFKIAKLHPNREDPSRSRVELTVTDRRQGLIGPQRETLVVEASIKPYINLVWMGTVTLIVGFVLTIVRRIQEARSK